MKLYLLWMLVSHRLMSSWLCSKHKLCTWHHIAHALYHSWCHKAMIFLFVDYITLSGISKCGNQKKIKIWKISRTSEALFYRYHVFWDQVTLTRKKEHTFCIDHNIIYYLTHIWISLISQLLWWRKTLVVNVSEFNSHNSISSYQIRAGHFQQNWLCKYRKNNLFCNTHYK